MKARNILKTLILLHIFAFVLIPQTVLAWEGIKADDSSRVSIDEKAIIKVNEEVFIISHDDQYSAKYIILSINHNFGGSELYVKDISTQQSHILWMK